MPTDKVLIAIGFLLGATVLASIAIRLLQEAAREAFEIKRNTY